MNLDHHPTTDSAITSFLYCMAFLCACAGAALLGFLGIEAASYADRTQQCTSSIRSDELPLKPSLTAFEQHLLGK
jgi:hypothetical protein